MWRITPINEQSSISGKERDLGDRFYAEAPAGFREGAGGGFCLKSFLPQTTPIKDHVH